MPHVRKSEKTTTVDPHKQHSGKLVIPAMGMFQYLCMTEIEKLGLDAYAAKVKSNLSSQLGRDVNIGQISTTLSALVDCGCVKRAGTKWAGAGRPRIILELTPFGATLLKIGHLRLGGII